MTETIPTELQTEPATPQDATQLPQALGSLPADVAETPELTMQSITDKNGRELIRAIANDNFAAFFLMGEDGEPRAMASLSEGDVPQVVLADSQRRNVLSVSLNNDGSLAIVPL